MTAPFFSILSSCVRVKASVYFLFILPLLISATACNEEDIKPREEEPSDPVLVVGETALLLPADYAIEVAPSEVTFSWSAPAPGVRYTLKVSTNPDLSDPLVDETGLTDTTLTLTGLLAGGSTYYWTVAADLADADPIATPPARELRTVMPPAPASPGRISYYVAPGGRDLPDAGTANSPFRSLGYASRRVPAGENDTIFLAPGTYEEREAALIEPGVNLIGAGVDEVTLTAPSVRLPSGLNPNFSDFKLWHEGSLIQLVSPTREIKRNLNSAAIAPTDGNQVLAGFTIDGQQKQLKAGLWVEGRNNVHLHDIHFNELQQRGAVVTGGPKRWYQEPDYYLTGIRIHDLSFVNSGMDLDNETLGNLNLSQLDEADIYNIDIEDTEGYGIKFIIDGYFINTHIHNCTIKLAETDQLWGEDIAIELWNIGPGNEVDHIRSNTWLSLVNHPNIFGDPQGYDNLKVHDVHIIDEDSYSQKEGFEIGVPGVEIYDNYVENKGFAIAFWDMGRGRALVRNNVFYNSRLQTNWAQAPAIYIDNSRDWAFGEYIIVNNVFDRFRFGLRIKGENVSDVLIANNAFINISEADLESTATGVRFTHNLRYSAEGDAWTFTGNAPNEETNNVSGNPEFRFQGQRFDGYYLPVPGGFAVDRGVDVGLPFTGAAPDIGPGKE